MPPQPQAKPQPQQAQNRPPQGGGQPHSIEGFDPRAFAQNLAQEASQVIPENISPADKKFIVELVHKFCLLCGDALAKDEKYNLNAQQASIITQFIGEWTFHKSVDLIHGGVAPELREGVLQKVAFTVFEIAKQAISRGMPQDQIISVIEIEVKNCFKQAMDDLKAKGKINDVTLNQTMNQSNIDDMSKEEFEQEQAQKQEVELSDVKISKLLSLALLIKKLPQEKAKAIISKFNQQEADVLNTYLRMPNLKDKLIKEITMGYLKEIKDVLPEPKFVTPDRIYRKLYKIVKSCDKDEISNMIENERPLIQQFILSPYTKEEIAIPLKIGSVVCRYLEEKLS